MKKSILAAFLSALLLLCFGCQAQNETAGSADYNDWQKVLADAKGTTVNFYGWGGDERINAYLDETLAPYLLKNYDVTLNRVPMGIDVILSTLSGEKTANADKSVIDVMWINGENFATAKDNDFLMADITKILPNYNYVDQEDPAIKYDFGTPTENFESPYGKAQFIFIADKAKLGELPTSAEKLMAYCKNNPGKITYIAPPDFTGSAFVRNIVYDIVGADVVSKLPNDKAKVKEAIQPALDYLVTLNDFLWQEGNAYPATYAELDQMFQDGLVNMSMNYDPLSVIAKINQGVYAKDTVAFAFDKGNLSNTHFVAISKNSGNKAAALCLVDAILSPEMQAAKLNPDIWGSLPGISLNKLEDTKKTMFDFDTINKDNVDIESLAGKQVAEPPSYLIPIIEELWQEEVAGQHDK